MKRRPVLVYHHARPADRRAGRRPPSGVAQSAERGPVKAKVVGSSPTAGANRTPETVTLPTGQGEAQPHGVPRVVVADQQVQAVSQSPGTTAAITRTRATAGYQTMADAFDLRQGRLFQARSRASGAATYA